MLSELCVSIVNNKSDFNFFFRDEDMRFGCELMLMTVPSRVQEGIIQLLDQPCRCISILSTQGAGKTVAAILAVANSIDTALNTTQAIFTVISCEAAKQTANILTRMSIYSKKSIHIGLAIQQNKGEVLT